MLHLLLAQNRVMLPHAKSTLRHHELLLLRAAFGGGGQPISIPFCSWILTTTYAAVVRGVLHWLTFCCDRSNLLQLDWCPVSFAPDTLLKHL